MPEFQDFKLICDGRDFPCSKAVLAARSDIFRAMFAHSDTREEMTGAAVVEDSTAEALEVFLKLLYTGNCERITEQTARCVHYNVLLNIPCIDWH